MGIKYVRKAVWGLLKLLMDTEVGKCSVETKKTRSGRDVFIYMYRLEHAEVRLYHYKDGRYGIEVVETQ